jgi:transcriptional regulator
VKHLTTEMKQQLDWRRNKVLELSSQGYSEREIADTIKVSDTTVYRDLVFLKDQAQENIQRTHPRNSTRHRIFDSADVILTVIMLYLFNNKHYCYCKK